MTFVASSSLWWERRRPNPQSVRMESHEVLKRFCVLLKSTDFFWCEVSLVSRCRHLILEDQRTHEYIE